MTDDRNRDNNKGGGSSDYPVARFTPGSPYLDPILQIVRSEDGWTPFYIIDPTLPKGKRFIELYSVQGKQLPLAFPDLVESLERDSYFGINPMIHPGRKKNPRHPSLPMPLRNDEKVKYLAACFTDLDLYDKGLTVDDGFTIARTLQREGDIPPVSLFCESGQGLWCMWLLREIDAPFQPPRAYPERKQLWGLIQSEIFARFQHAGADRGSKDMSRIMPVPGSLKTRNLSVPRRVVFTAQMDGNLRPFVYTLRELAEALGVEIHHRSAPTVTVQPKAVTPSKGKPKAEPKPTPTMTKPWGDRKGGWKTERARAAWKARWKHAVDDIRTLIALRGGGCSKGHRNKGALYLAVLLRYRGFNPDDIYSEVSHYGSKCNPPLTPTEVDHQIKSALKYKASRLYNSTLSREFDITPGEAPFLKKLRAASEADAPPPRSKPTREEIRADRHKAIRAIVDDLGHVPRVRELLERLEDQHGISASLQTIQADYDYLGIKNPRSKARGRKKKPGNLFST